MASYIANARNAKKRKRASARKETGAGPAMAPPVVHEVCVHLPAARCRSARLYGACLGMTSAGESSQMWAAESAKAVNALLTLQVSHRVCQRQREPQIPVAGFFLMNCHGAGAGRKGAPTEESWQDNGCPVSNKKFPVRFSAERRRWRVAQPCRSSAILPLCPLSGMTPTEFKFIRNCNRIGLWSPLKARELRTLCSRGRRPSYSLGH